MADYAQEGHPALSDAGLSLPRADRPPEMFGNASGFVADRSQFLNVQGAATQSLVQAVGSSAPDTEEVYSENEIYCSQLWGRQRGFPLYVPEPQQTLPPEYLANGVAIGDIGMVTPEGIWDFFFNIFLPRDDPINRNEVPEDFSPLESYQPGDVIHQTFQAGTWVSSASVQECSSGFQNFPGGEFLFHCRGPRGAVLALPHGSHLVKLTKRQEQIRQYATQNAASWYKYINLTMGRRMVNGELYLITGCEKSLDGGIATFQNTVPGSDFHLGFKPFPNPNSPYQFNRTPAHTKTFSGSNNARAAPALNNTVFLHGYTISLGEGLWGKLFGNIGISQITEAPFGKNRGGDVPFSSRGSGSILSFSFNWVTGGGGVNGKHSTALSGEGVAFSDLTATPKIDHPSQRINAIVAQQAPGAEVIITHDDDWGYILNNARGMKHDFLPNASDLRDQLLQHFQVIEENGIAYLKCKNIAVGVEREFNNILKLNVPTVWSPRFGKVTPASIKPSSSESKGGCWTCRLRRKKCDEKREGDSCHTCLRLSIDCLGWGPKRPEWMRAKPAVEAYRMDLKAHLTRAGLIRGQPRSALSAKVPTTSLFKPNDDLLPFGGPPQQNILFPTITSEYDFHAHPDLFSSDLFHSPTPDSGQITPLDFDFTQLGGDFDFSPNENAPPLFAGHSSLQENHCIYYLEHVRKVQFIFAGNSVANVTCAMIAEGPRGPVANAVCALASLHYTRMRVAHGLEAPDPNPEHSAAKYFHDKASFQLHNAKQVHGMYGESDALAALHLVWFSQLSGGATDWQPVFSVACDWLAQQTELLSSDDPKLAMQHLSTSGQLIVKLTLWLEILSSLTVMHPPKYLALYKRLFCDLAGWQSSGDGIRMDTLTGYPEEVLLGIAEVSGLSHWKAAEKRKGTFSNRDLIRRGDEIEQRLRKSLDGPPRGEAIDTTPMHPTLVQAESEAAGSATYLGADARQLVAKIFFETVLLYLHTVLSDSNPDVPEISASVGLIVQYLGQLPASEVDRALVFPICLAGCMTDDSTRREFLKDRLQQRDQSLGNLMRTRLLMEAVWQKRDLSGATVDWREEMWERGLNLLLV